MTGSHQAITLISHFRRSSNALQLTTQQACFGERYTIFSGFYRPYSDSESGVQKATVPEQYFNCIFLQYLFARCHFMTVKTPIFGGSNK
jgi:hypothetical protein